MEKADFQQWIIKNKIIPVMIAKPNVKLTIVFESFEFKRDIQFGVQLALIYCRNIYGFPDTTLVEGTNQEETNTQLVFHCKIEKPRYFNENYLQIAMPDVRVFRAIQNTKENIEIIEKDHQVIYFNESKYEIKDFYL